MKDERITVCGGSFINIWICDKHPNERWDVHRVDNPICIPCEVLHLRSEVDRMEKVIYAIRRHSDSLRERLTVEGIANPIQSSIQEMIQDKTVDFDNAIQTNVYRIACAVLAYLDGEG